ncbi:MAG: hypothetical protein KJ749_10785 [Planctomycetes bacterium]|nr:hypothetical protein [Planctomycetota bacterium]
MSDASSLNPSEGGDGDAVTEDDLDQLLSEASALANEIAAGVGEEDESASSPAGRATTTGADNQEDPPANLDAQLAELDNALAQTAVELGVGAGIDDCPEAIDKPDAPSPATEDNVENSVAEAGEAPAPRGVDSNAELDRLFGSDDEEEENALARPDGTGSPSPTPRGSAGIDVGDDEGPAGWALDSSIPDLSEPARQEATRSPSLGDAAAVATPKTSAEEAHVPANATGTAGAPFRALSIARSAMGRVGQSKQITGLLARLSPLGLGVCERGAGMLEALDKPTQRLGPGIRRAIGWLAIATIGTSLIVFVISMF